MKPSGLFISHASSRTFHYETYTSVSCRACRLFGVKRCDRCQAGIHAKDLVTRVNDQVYHVDCFTCASCGVVLRPGHQFRMRDGLAHCLLHYELVYSHNGYCGGVELEATFRTGDSPAHYYSTGVGVQKGRPRKRKLSPAVDTADLPIAMRLPAAALGNRGAVSCYTQGCCRRVRHLRFLKKQGVKVRLQTSRVHDQIRSYNSANLII